MRENTSHTPKNTTKSKRGNMILKARKPNKGEENKGNGKPSSHFEHVDPNNEIVENIW